MLICKVLRSQLAKQAVELNVSILVALLRQDCLLFLSLLHRPLFSGQP